MNDDLDIMEQVDKAFDRMERYANELFNDNVTTLYMPRR